MSPNQEAVALLIFTQLQKWVFIGRNNGLWTGMMNVGNERSKVKIMTFKLFQLAKITWLERQMDLYTDRCRYRYIFIF